MTKDNLFRNKKGVTLIELLVSLGILALAVGLTGGILLSIVKAYQRSSLLSSMKRNGNYALTLVSDNIRSAQKVECFKYSSFAKEYVRNSSPCSVVLREGEYGGLVITDTLGAEKEIGFVQPTPGQCSDNTSLNGFVYIKNYDEDHPIPSEIPNSQKVTNDANTSEGINIVPGKDISQIGADTGNPVVNITNNNNRDTVTVTFTIKNPLCNSVVTKTEIFQTTVLPRQKSGP